MRGKEEVTLVLRPAVPLPEQAPGPKQKHLTHAELHERHAAHPRIHDRITDFAAKHHLEVVNLDSARRVARLAGSRADLQAAFSEAGDGDVAIPRSLRQDVAAVLGLSPERRVRRRTVARDLRKNSGRTLRELAEAYQFPQHASGAGQTIGIIEFGGGFRLSDIAQFCKRNNVPVPRITVIPVEGAKNSPAHADALRELLDAMSGVTKLSSIDQESPRMQSALSTVEVTMDVEIVAALAPGAHIVVYFAPSDQQFHALQRAVFDQRHKPSVLSISWGQPETEIRASTIQAVNMLLHTAVLLGITVCASSGDQGATDGSQDGLPTVNFPASSPFCLACGGTTTHFAKRRDGLRVMRETVWNSTYFHVHGASGGGVSRIFPLPEWQRGALVPLNPSGRRGRGVPDVAGVADPRFGCDLLIASRTFSSVGTSAVAPMWAALVARYNAALGRRCGHINAPLYRFAAEKAGCLRPVLKGSNGAYEAGPGWNACTGYGTPVGTALLQSLEAHFRDTNTGA